MPLGTRAVPLTPQPADAPPAARVRESGGVLLAKTTMPDYGMLSSGRSSFHPLTRNPWNLAWNPGGSSAGAGAAAAAGLGPQGRQRSAQQPKGSQKLLRQQQLMGAGQQGQEGQTGGQQGSAVHVRPPGRQLSEHQFKWRAGRARRPRAIDVHGRCKTGRDTGPIRSSDTQPQLR